MNMKRIAIIILSILMPFLCDAQKPFERGKTLYMDGMMRLCLYCKHQPRRDMVKRVIFWEICTFMDGESMWITI